ncbi:hypothetical protein [Promicromonospora sukumoe]|uniref:Uncharacterized protein n=1 Tax=Promicromonospora sukumoe TaxID=88382 RepID=A0A7W3PDN8_9MICO|nr:hypothetical protein [Promicromonospora sukumoe]MBA8807747.1 hypothetical protein [Promicromonospora sukumoe]
MSSLIDLLGRYDDARAVEWLEGRRAILESDRGLERKSVISDLHRIVLGMGGLMDMRLSGPSPEMERQANVELRALADRLYELTNVIKPPHE